MVLDTFPHPELDSQFRYLSISIVRKTPSVYVVALNRERKRNAINAAMWKEIGRAFSTLGTLGDGCRCIILIGSGKAFCAGIDVMDPSFFAPDHEDVARRGIGFRPQILEMQRCFTAIETCPVPVVAAIHGNCIGAGVDMICCADVRYCSDDAVFSVREAKLGLAADIGTLQRLPHIVGFGSRVRELCFTGDNFDAQEAYRIGLVSAASSNYLSMALQTCVAIADNSPVAVAGTKLSLNYSRDHSVAEGLEHVAMHNSTALMTTDMIESFTGVSQGTKPTFQNLLPHSRL